MVPLIPLTAFRVVRNAMGNIVRLLSSATSADDLQQSATWSDPQPASQELEAVVAAYFKDLNMSPEPVNVWALIAPKVKGSWSQQRNEGSATRTMRLWTPQEIRSLWTAEDAQKQRDRIVNSTTLRMLRAGGRLHRVLSGGGGWGKKAGLLSLDPDMVYSSRELRGEKGWDFDFEGEGAEAVEKQQRQALGEIVQEGESIMFLIAPRDTEQFEEGRKSAWNFVNRADRSAVFGAIPSTIDLVPDELTSDRVGTTAPTIRHQPNLFGAYSEGGLALDVLINDQRLNDGEPRSAIHTQTKLDVPYSHFRITEAAGDAEAIAAQRTAHRTRGSDRKRYDGTPRRGESGRSNDVSTWGMGRRRDAPNVERIRHRSGIEVKNFTFGDRRDYSTDSTNGFDAVAQESATSEDAGDPEVKGIELPQHIRIAKHKIMELAELHARCTRIVQSLDPAALVVYNKAMRYTLRKRRERAPVMLRRLQKSENLKDVGSLKQATAPSMDEAWLEPTRTYMGKMQAAVSLAVRKSGSKVEALPSSFQEQPEELPSGFREALPETRHQLEPSNTVGGVTGKGSKSDGNLSTGSTGKRKTSKAWNQRSLPSTRTSESFRVRHRAFGSDGKHRRVRRDTHQNVPKQPTTVSVRERITHRSHRKLQSRNCPSSHEIKIRRVRHDPDIRISRQRILSDPPAAVTEAVQREARRVENRRKVYAKMAAERSELWDTMAQSGRDSGTTGQRVEADSKHALTGTARDELIDDVRGFAGYWR
ncbi:hypothetical protein LTR86_005901 [Recurvomyces mirabilis]|nr:hypothetical protein LTR86_005901 [Recurvomyces mirabilis]